jgi:hypothetical protein
MTTDKLGPTLSNVISEQTGCNDGETHFSKLEVYERNDDGDPVGNIAQHGANLFVTVWHQQQNVFDAVKVKLT